MICDGSFLFDIIMGKSKDIEDYECKSNLHRREQLQKPETIRFPPLF